MRPKYYEVDQGHPERVILAGVQLSGVRSWEVQESLEELTRLAHSAGAEIIDCVQQKKSHPDAACFIGRGKAEELAKFIEETKADSVIFDEDLTPAQARNLETIMQVKVVDRTELILDIFAQRAHTREGKLQVELAQLHYRLPRLIGKGIMLSRLGGGIGTRGPGETKLEVDRRRIRDRISYLEKAIEVIKSNRAQQRSQRKKSQIPVIALVGYTNAGKSTLLNKLCGTHVLVEDKLFATLDPTTRRLELPNGQGVVMTDTVGFIRKLPHHLVAAFRATLEEIRQADLLLHVVDSSHPNRKEHITAVLEVLQEIEAQDKPVITVWNKIDRLDMNEEGIAGWIHEYAPGVAISAEKEIGFDKLLKLLVKQFEQRWKTIQLLIPHNRSDIVAELHQNAKINRIQYVAKGTRLEVQILPEMMGKYAKFELS